MLLAILTIVAVALSIPCDSAHCPNTAASSAHNRCWPLPSLQFCSLSLSAQAFLAIPPIVAVGTNSPRNSAHCRCWPRLSLQSCPLSLLAPTLLAILPTFAVGPVPPCKSAHCRRWPNSPYNSAHCRCWPHLSLQFWPLFLLTPTFFVILLIVVVGPDPCLQFCPLSRLLPTLPAFPGRSFRKGLPKVFPGEPDRVQGPLGRF
jgi:hypothetical protein